MALCPCLAVDHHEYIQSARTGPRTKLRTSAYAFESWSEGIVTPRKCEYLGPWEAVLDVRYSSRKLERVGGLLMHIVAAV
jgi:hypothetical protein